MKVKFEIVRKASKMVKIFIKKKKNIKIHNICAWTNLGKMWYILGDSRDTDVKGGSVMYSVFDVANWFLQKEEMTNKKLQKLCYYAQAWSYAFNNKKMFDGDFEAWVHGPVNRSLWNALRNYGYDKVESNHFSKSAHNIEDDSILELLEDVWATYGEFSGGQLEALTHREKPWCKARIGLDEYEPSQTLIAPDDMRSYYRSLLVEN